MNSLNNINSLRIDIKELKDITNLYEHKGKDFYYLETFKKDINSITTDVVLRNCKAIINFKKINISDSRLRQLVKKDSPARNKDEHLIKNTATIINTFAAHIKEFDFNTNQFLNLARVLFNQIKKIEFKVYNKKVQENLLMVDKKFNCRDVLEEMIKKYESLLKSQKYELVSLVASFYIDFMMEEIFNDENEFIGMFIIYSLLFKARFELFRFTSFIEVFYNNYDEFKDALAKSEFGWHEGYPNASHLTSVLRRIMIDCYSKIDGMLKTSEIISGNQKTSMIEYSILRRLPDVFTKEMVQEMNPNASMTTIDRTLSRLRNENKIRPNGTGRSATWTRIYNEDKYDNNKALKQFTIADYIPEEE